MAWLIGKVTREERALLEGIGWELFDPKIYFGNGAGFTRSDVCVYVDNDLYSIMRGPDWEQGTLKPRQPKLERACNERGAQMGRPDRLPPENLRHREVKLNIEEMEMGDDGCYDKGGAYWGCGTPESGRMWIAWGDIKGHFVTVFARAVSRAQAETKVRKDLPNVLFYT